MASSARTAAARGLGVRPPATGGATRRAISDAVGRAARRDSEQARGGRPVRRWAGPRRGEARGMLAGPTSVVGQK